MNRRRFLRATSVPLTLAAAGCSALDSSSKSTTTTTEDTDGDGIPDSEDYAPRDPEVQVESDLNTTAKPTTESPDSEQTTTTTTEPTPTTTTTTTDPVPTNTIQANYEPIQDAAFYYFKSYSLQGTRLVVRREEEDQAIDRNMKLAIFAQEYPDGTEYDRHVTPAKTIEVGKNEFVLDYELDVTTSEPFYLAAIAFPGDQTLEETIDKGNAEYLCETDRLKIKSENLEKARHPEAKSTLEKPSYTRTSGEGVYLIEISGDVDFAMTVYKQAYVSADAKEFQQTKDVILDSHDTGISATLASIFHDEAKQAGRASGRQKVNYIVSAIQALPYVKDSVDDSYDNYNKYPIETLVEAGGDCEDTVILLASTLYAEPFNYGMVLIRLPYEDPTHIGLGIKGSDDVEGTYYTYEDERYYYVETTGEGWEVGELPEQYEDDSAEIIPLF